MCRHVFKCILVVRCIFSAGGDRVKVLQDAETMTPASEDIMIEVPALIQVDRWRHPSDSRRHLTNDSFAHQISRKAQRSVSAAEGPLMLGAIQHAPTGSLHEVVGNDGVLMITLERELSRFTFASHELQKVGIVPTVFPATDAQSSPPDALSLGCLLKGPGKYERSADCPLWKNGGGCQTTAEQATAASHRRALEAALERNEDWTAIFEDDAVPVTDEPGRWDAEFRQAWAQRPAEARIIRLNWCFGGFPASVGAPPTTVGSFMWVHTADPGGCTTAYMVHKEVIPQLLQSFPCCIAVDACFEGEFFKKCAKETPGTLRSASGILVNLDVNLDAFGMMDGIWEARRHDGDALPQRGVIMQAKGSL
jgi:hypothetical protein